MTVVSDIMTSNVFTVSYQARVRDALAMLYEHDIRRVPVVDDTRRVVGIVTERDLREHLGPPAEWSLDPESRKEALNDPVSEIMTTTPDVVCPETPLSELITLLIDTKYGGMPVVDAKNTLLGIVTYIDVLRHIRDLA